MATATTISSATAIRVAKESQEVEVTLSVPLAKGGASAAKNILDCLPSGDGPAIKSVSGGEQALTYDALRGFLAAQDIRGKQGVGPGDRVAVVMPNGPEMAVTFLLCMAKATAVPLEPSLSLDDLVDAFEQLDVAQCFCLRQDKVYDDHIRQACFETGVKLKYLIKGQKHAGHVLFAKEGLLGSVSDKVVVGPPVVVEMKEAPLVAGASGAEGAWTGLDAPSLLLRTSGTTSKPKVVPLTLRGLLTGSTCIAQGLGLQTTDECLNVMPYTHIGGISCNLLGSIVTGACVRCTPGFDPARFLGWLEEFQSTWYYAVPTVHMAARLACGGNAPKHALRFIRNGGANLTDADAQALHELFGCPVYPTYSMSECMPIAQPPKGYSLEKPGTVGVPVASSVRVVGEDGRTAVAASASGEVRGELCIAGPVVMAGYLDGDEANEQSFFEDGGKRWFRTGDVGYIDSDGYVFLTGRSKELIKRGGEQVSPYEVEEALMKHPAVQVAVVFSVPNDFWGEEVAAAVVLKEGFSERDGVPADFAKALRRKSLRRIQAESSLAQTALTLRGVDSRPSLKGTEVSAQELMAFAAEHLVDAKVPRQVKVVTEDQLPKTRSKKYQRTGLWEKLGLQAVDLRAQQELGSEPIAGGVLVHPPVEVSPAVHGVRFFLAIWVIFIHYGDFPPWMAVWRNVSISMPAFFVLAGFLLEKATTRPIANTRKFFRQRFIASHPLFLFSVLWIVPFYLFALAWQISVSNDQIVRKPELVIGYLVAGIYGWGYWMSPTLWFSLMYNACVFLFPLLHDALNHWQIFNIYDDPTEPLCGGQGEDSCTCIKYACYPGACWVAIFSAISSVAFTIAWAWLPAQLAEVYLYYHGLPLWLFIFACGMFTYKVFEFSRRGLPKDGGFQGWGCITDLLTLALFAVMGLMSSMVDPVSFSAPNNWRQALSVAANLQEGKCYKDSNCQYAACAQGAGLLHDGSNVPVSWDSSMCVNDPDATNFCFHNLKDVNGVLPCDSEGWVRNDTWCQGGELYQQCEPLGTNGNPWALVSEYPSSILLGALLGKPMRLGTPIICVWLYGLATGQGLTAKFCSLDLFAKTLSPSAYAMYLLQIPLGMTYVAITRAVLGGFLGQSITDNFDLAEDVGAMPIFPWEFPILVALVALVAYRATNYWNEMFTSWFQKVFNILYFPLPCLCTGVGPCQEEAGGGEETTLQVILDVISNLTGVDADATSKLTAIGLDSFGAGTLVGALAGRLPGMTLRAVDIYKIETVGDLAVFIDKDPAPEL